MLGEIKQVEDPVEAVPQEGLAEEDEKAAAGVAEMEDPQDRCPVFNVPEEKQCCNCIRLCSFPLGQNAVYANVLAILSLILSLAGTGSCHFFRVGDDMVKWGFLWRQETEAENEATFSRITDCIRWTPAEKQEHFDAIWKTASAFAYLTIITVVVATGVTFSLSCATINRFYARLLGTAFLFASIFQVLVFLGLDSELCKSVECSLSFGAGLAIGGITLCLLTSITLFLLHPAAPKRPVSTSTKAASHKSHSSGNAEEREVREGSSGDASSTHHDEEEEKREPHVVQDDDDAEVEFEISDDGAVAEEDPTLKV